MNQEKHGLILQQESSQGVHTLIDNLQGVMRIRQPLASSSVPNSISIGNVEHGVFSIDAAESNVDLTVNSLHDSSRIHSKWLTLNMTEEARKQIRIVLVEGAGNFKAYE